MAGMDSNAERIADTVDDLRGVLSDLSPANEAAAAIVLPIAVEQSPRLTGRLAASLVSVVGATSYGITSPLPYAATVHARQPWIADVITAHAADQVRAVDDYITAHTPA